jgi:hypothetical protein
MTAASTARSVPFLPSFAPVNLSYAAALRGARPRVPGAPFNALYLGAAEWPTLIALAASNEEGKFFVADANAARITEATAAAHAAGVDNIDFIPVSLADLFAGLKPGASSALPPLDYLTVDAAEVIRSSDDLESVYGIAILSLLPGGLFGFAYNSIPGTTSGDQALSYLAGALSQEGGTDWVQDMATLGTLYFAAAGAGRKDAFLQNPTAIPSATTPPFCLTAISDLKHFGLSFLGSGLLDRNYLEASVPPEAHPVLLKYRGHALYEAMKDFAANSYARLDIFARDPVPYTDNLVPRFGGFTYAIRPGQKPSDRILNRLGNRIDLTGTLYDTVFDLLGEMPLTIGDLVNHPQLAGTDQLTILSAVQLLVGLQIASPMRASFAGNNTSGCMTTPKLAGGYNRRLRRPLSTLEPCLLASPTLGQPIQISGEDALVLHAIDSAAFEGCVGVMADDLARLKVDYRLAGQDLSTQESRQQVAGGMIEKACEQDLVNWYIYGILQS